MIILFCKNYYYLFILSLYKIQISSDYSNHHNLFILYNCHITDRIYNSIILSFNLYSPINYLYNYPKLILRKKNKYLSSISISPRLLLCKFRSQFLDILILLIPSWILIVIAFTFLMLISTYTTINSFVSMPLRYFIGIITITSIWRFWMGHLNICIMQ